MKSIIFLINVFLLNIFGMGFANEAQNDLYLSHPESFIITRYHTQDDRFQLQIRYVFDEKGSILYAHTFSYDARGNLIKIIPLKIDKNDSSLSNKVETYSMTYSYSNDQLVSIYVNHFNSQADVISEDLDDADNFYRYSIFNEPNDYDHQVLSLDVTGPTQETYNNKNNLEQNAYLKANVFEETFFSIFHTITDFIKDNLSLEHDFKDKIEEGALTIFSKASLNLYGFYLDKQEVGTFGQGEINDKVRITLINGILNARHDLIDTLEMLSKFHGDNNIHYIFRPTEGWTYDLLKSSLVKFGWASPQSKQLAVRWKELIAEMGGVDGGGKIIHYAHSIGAVDSFIAKRFLKPEELKMIQVYTFGSPLLFGPEGFHSVTNYISKGDGVSLLDPVGYIKSLMHPSDHIAFIPSSWPIPIIDHPLTFPAYQSTLEMLGRQFLEIYKPRN